MIAEAFLRGLGLTPQDMVDLQEAMVGFLRTWQDFYSVRLPRMEARMEAVEAAIAVALEARMDGGDGGAEE